MPIVTKCPKCRATFNLADSLAGKKAKCARCQQLFLVPAVPAEPPPAKRVEPPIDVPMAELADDAAEPVGGGMTSAPMRRPSRPQPPWDPFAPGGGAPYRPPTRSASGVGWIIALAVGIPVLLLLLLSCGAGVFGYLMYRTAAQTPPVAVASAPMPQKKAAAPVPANPPPMEPERPGPLDRPLPPDPFNPPPPKPRDPPPALKPPTLIDVTPAALAQDKVVKPLPSAVGDVAVGGGGRFLILYLPQQNKLEQNKLAIFDVSAAETTKSLSFNEPNLKFAAGMDKLIVALPNSRVLRRYSLKTFEEEQSAPLPIEGDVDALCMGSASSGPLWVQQKSDPAHPGTAMLVDPSTLKEWPADWGEQRPPADAVFLRASEDGQVFTMRNGVGGEPHEVTCVNLRGGRATAHKTVEVQSSFLNPDRTGRMLYSGAGLYTNQFVPIFPRPIPESYPKAFLPSHGGPYFARLDFKDWWQVGPGTLSFFLPDADTPFAALPGVEGVTNEMDPYGKLESPPPFDQRIHIVPAAKVVVSLPKGEDRLILYRFDPEAALDKSDVNYLVVTSRPPPGAKKGQEYAYPLAVKSRKGGVKYTLASGPKAMHIDAAGKLTWTPPADAEAENDVSVSVTDVGGQETLHSFRIGVE